MEINARCERVRSVRIRSPFGYALSLIVRLLPICFLTISSTSVFGQLQVTPTQRPGFSLKQVPSNARQKDVGPLKLPFWDDFSTTGSAYPDQQLWVDSYNVWINDGMAVNAPTVNVATFDGLDSAGLAFNPNDVLVSGYTDVLTSREIDLGEPAVTAAERSSVYLSFFYQWQGNGEAPDNGDFLELQFRDSTGAWQSVLSIYPQDHFDRTEFYDTALAVGNGVFFHDTFQFRFRAFGRQSGPYDTWNLDYVFLNKGRSADEESFPDVAAASELSTLFGMYHAVPYTHFLKSQAVGPLTFDVKNLDNNNGLGRSVNYSVAATFTRYFASDTTATSDVLVASRGVDGSSGYMVPYRRINVDVATLPDASNESHFDTTAKAVDVTIDAIVISKDDSVAASELARFSPYDLRVNDTVSATFRLADYYAYDDGVAEFAAG
ncbi:MAG TPA: hypothetical protein VEB86_04940, partial [Chryseosolibacter sp.]|nr:hypothetical protein [Chryseosolibacter sp.]